MSTTDRGGERGAERQPFWDIVVTLTEYHEFLLERNAEYGDLVKRNAPFGSVLMNAAKELAALAAERDRLRAMLEEVEVYLEDHEDVVDGDYGEPAANKAMRLLLEVRAALSGGRHG